MENLVFIASISIPIFQMQNQNIFRPIQLSPIDIIPARPRLMGALRKENLPLRIPKENDSAFPISDIAAIDFKRAGRVPVVCLPLFRADERIISVKKLWTGKPRILLHILIKGIWIWRFIGCNSIGLQRIS